jgi:hypothetical protein
MRGFPRTLEPVEKNRALADVMVTKRARNLPVGSGHAAAYWRKLLTADCIDTDLPAG